MPPITNIEQAQEVYDNLPKAHQEIAKQYFTNYLQGKNGNNADLMEAVRTKMLQETRK